MTKLIVGLGNPGTKYQKTRHNLGFLTLDQFLSESTGKFGNFKLDKKNKAQIATSISASNSDQKIILAKPTTFMNSSGESVSALAKYYKVKTENIIVIYDDVDILFGETRKTGTSAGGHRGLQSIIDHLKSTDFMRLRLGIKPKSGIKIPTDKFVLQKFNLGERLKISGFLDKAVTDLGLMIK
tara:strand:- start:872 stop:1420 length:549 start_codon:yes stop_codon:yes gene_type:complete